MQLIPSLDLMRGRLVRLRHGDPQQATFYDMEPEDWIGSLAEAGARRIHLVDLDGAFGRPRQGRFTAFPSQFPEIRFQVGGGLRDRAAIEEVLDLGFDAVVGTLAVEQPAALQACPATMSSLPWTSRGTASSPMGGRPPAPWPRRKCSQP